MLAFDSLKIWFIRHAENRAQPRVRKNGRFLEPPYQVSGNADDLAECSAVHLTYRRA